MKSFRTFILFLLIITTFYCYGAGMMDYFAIYGSWKLISDNDFTALHHFLGQRVLPIFVFPSAVMTLINVVALIFPACYVNKKLLWISLIAYSFDWIFSFTMQIPIQLELSEGKNMALIDELIRTNWWRFAADTIQFLAICAILWQLLRKLETRIYAHL